MLLASDRHLVQLDIVPTERHTVALLAEPGVWTYNVRMRNLTYAAEYLGSMSANLMCRTIAKSRKYRLLALYCSSKIGINLLANSLEL